MLEEKKDVKKGLIQILIGSLTLIALFLTRQLPITEEYAYIYFLIGAFGLIINLIGFARLLFNAPVIFQWVGKKFGIKVLAVIVLIFALIATGLSILIVLHVFIKKSFHVEIMIFSIIGTILLWFTFYRILKIIFRRKKVKNKDYNKLSNYNQTPKH